MKLFNVWEGVQGTYVRELVSPSTLRNILAGKKNAKFVQNPADIVLFDSTLFPFLHTVLKAVKRG